MSKWYVEYKAYGKFGYMSGIEAENGKEAIEVVKSKVIGATKFYVLRDEDEEENGNGYDLQGQAH